MKQITILKRDINYTNLEGFSSSLEHSLRIRDKDTDNVMYDESLIHNNKIFYEDEFQNPKSPQESQKILTDILDKISSESNSNTKTKEEKTNAKNLKSYKTKLKNFYSDNSDEVKDIVISAMENYKNFDENIYKNLLSLHGISEKSIKHQVPLMKKFCDASVIYETSNQKKNIYNANHVKEVILVIPTTNGVEVSEKTNSFLLKTAIEFYKENHPHNEILIGFSHSDETTNHCHLFINLRNSKTNKFDFVEQETALADENRSMALRDKPMLENFITPKRKESTAKKLLLNELSKWRGETLQRVFYQHFNNASTEQLMGFTAQFNVKDSSNEEAYRFMNEQSNLPKEKRQLNYLHKKVHDVEEQMEQINTALIEVSEANNIASQKAQNLNTIISNLQTKEKKADEIISAKANRIKSLKSSTTTFENNIRILSDQQEEKEKKLKRLDDSIHEKNQTKGDLEDSIKALSKNNADISKDNKALTIKNQSLIKEAEAHDQTFKNKSDSYFNKVFNDIKELYSQMLGLLPVYKETKRKLFEKLIFKKDLLAEEDLDIRIKKIVEYKSTSSIETFNNTSNYPKELSDFENRVKTVTKEVVKHRAAQGRSSKNEWENFYNPTAPKTKVGNTSPKNNLDIN